MYKLTIELVPLTSWYNNVRSKVSQEEWDIIRKKCYKNANYKCEICGGVGNKWPVECHEIWEYDDKKHIQKLVGFVALCPSCHEVKHIGLAEKKGRLQHARNHLIGVNSMLCENEANIMIHLAFMKYEERSEHKWKVDVSYLDKFLGKQNNAKNKSTDNR